MKTRTMLGATALALLTAGTAATLTGCDTTAAPYGGRLDPVQPYPKISQSPVLYELIAFSEPVVTPGMADRPLQVSTPCRSTQDGITRVQYQYEWFDEAGRPTGESGWKYVVIPARTQVFMEANALTTTAKDWRLTVRPAG